MNYKNSIAMYKGGFRAFAFNSQAAALLNKRLLAYALDVDFVAERSEGVFDFKQADYAFVKAVLSKHGGMDSET